ncbi:sensor histidine kinase [Aquabacterium sp.]|uniref:sensor histidine kinase n=1 Tax=Aquabacterium sp. TaxID=1872578 RepID=UPI002C9999C9|nr:ATP-binding protein [Aquabacterium sp.]HSW06317.1 ATP-binding protein [Aquabacterium sp.]
MNSIRVRLLLSLLVALVLAAAVVGGVTYRNVLHEAETLFDYQLRQMALSLRDQGEIAGDEAAALRDEDLDFVVQIWRIDGRSVYASRAHKSLPSSAVMGFADIAVDGRQWRSFGIAAHDRVIQVAQPIAIREGLAANAALRSVLPLVAVAPLLAAALWWLIERSLRPLSRMARALRETDVATLRPLPDAGLPDEVAPLVRSLNAMLERLGQAFDSQRAFVADAAHELRSPLTALKLQAQLLRRAGDEHSRGAALDTLVAGVDRATRLVEQLLTLARQEPGAAPRAHEPVALAPLLRQVLADSAPLAQARGTALSLQVEAADETASVPGDAAALAVLARNLVDNALRYTPAGGQVQAGVARDGGRLLLRIDDSGPGIPNAERERVFGRFVRGSTAAQDSGSGLGLAIVRSIAERHAAQLALLDSPLGGLRVELRFPAA